MDLPGNVDRSLSPERLHLFGVLLRRLQFHLFRGRPSFQILGGRGRKENSRLTGQEIRSGQPGGSRSAREGTEGRTRWPVSMDFGRFAHLQGTSNPNSSWVSGTASCLGPGPACPRHTDLPLRPPPVPLGSPSVHPSWKRCPPIICPPTCE